MNLKLFTAIIENYKKSSEIISELYSIGFDLMEGKYTLSDQIYNQFILALETTYTNDAIEWISWFIFENDYGKKDWSKTKDVNGKFHTIYGATDERGKPICYSIESLHDHIKTYII